jgi:hypothetical protein
MLQQEIKERDGLVEIKGLGMKGGMGVMRGQDQCTVRQKKLYVLF